MIWNQVALPTSGGWRGCSYGGGKFVAAGYSSAKAIYSTDGTTWLQTTMPSTANWTNVAYGNGVWVAVTAGSSKSAYSTDGITWTASALPSVSFVTGLAFGGGKFVAVDYNTTNKAFYTTDGVTWIPTALPSSATWESVAYGNGRFVAVARGSNKSAYSTDGITWAASTIPSSETWRGVAFGDGKFMVVSTGSNKSAYSTDGVTWIPSALPSTGDWFSIAFGLDRFVSPNNQINASFFEGAWKDVSNNISTQNWYATAYGNGKFVSLAFDTSTAMVSHYYDPLKFDSILPSSVNVVEGANVEFSAVVSGGTGTVSYKWLLDGTEVSTANPYNRSMQFSDNGKTMVCRATDGVTTVDSSAIPISVYPTNEFKVYVDKSEIRLNESEKTKITATALFGAEPAVFSDNGKTIQCKGISGTEISYSETLLITVIPVVLGVTISPATMSGIEGESKSFTALATGGRRTYSYAWLVDGVQRGSESTLSLTLSASDAGKTLFCRVSDGEDIADSNSVVLSIIPTALSATISPSGIFKMAHGETQLFRCFPVGGGGNPYSYEWTLGGVVVSTSKDYSYKAVGVVDNGKQIQCKVIAGAQNVLSNAVTLDIVQAYPYRITQGAESVDISPLYGYTTTIELSMERGTGAGGIVQWLDNEQRYDDYKTAFQFFTANGNSGKIERMMCGDSVSVVNIVAPTGNGFRPLGIEYGTNYAYPVNISEFVIDGRVDAFGDLMAYKMTIVPAVSNVVSNYPVATEISDIETANHWTIGGVYFPFSQWMQELNDVRNVLITGGGSSQIVDTTKPFGDVAKISVNCVEEQARKIVQFITTLFRGTTQTANFPIGYCIFGKRYESITSCKVKLHSNILTVKHNGLNSLDIEFELQMVGL